MEDQQTQEGVNEIENEAMNRELDEISAELKPLLDDVLSRHPNVQLITASVGVFKDTASRAGATHIIATSEHLRNDSKGLLITANWLCQELWTRLLQRVLGPAEEKQQV